MQPSRFATATATATATAIATSTLLATGVIGLAVAPRAVARPADAPGVAAAPASSAPAAPVATPTVAASPVPAQPNVPTPSASAAPGRPTTGGIRVPAGQADVGHDTTTSSVGHDALLAGLVCGGALLVASGAVVVVARRSR